MLFKLSVGNIRRSIRDYAVYFFTLIIGVSVFYVFNAVETQVVMMEVTGSRNDVIQLLSSMLSGISVFVAIVLGLLIVYAARFLMKRRSREFALYMMLGTGKGKISAILLIETLFIGAGSLIVGLFLGIGLSQLMSVLVANLFEADMSAYKFCVSSGAIIKTVLYFAVMYLVVIIFNGAAITRMKLIDLMQSGKRSEKIKMKNPVACVIVFVVAALMLGYAYSQVGWHYSELTKEKMAVYILMGMVSTFLIFWSVSGMLLRIVMSMKNVYHRGLNAFTFRQISSKINTMVFSMSAICLMLFVTICALSAAFSIRNSMNANLKNYCPADFEIEIFRWEDDVKAGTPSTFDIAKIYSEHGENVCDGISDWVQFSTYSDLSFTMGDFFGKDNIDMMKKNFPMLSYETPEQIIKLSDYNSLMKLYGMKTFELSEDQFILACNYDTMKSLRNQSLGAEKEIFGRSLKSKFGTCVDGFISLSSQKVNAGFFIVPDSVVDASRPAFNNYFIGNYTEKSPEHEKMMVGRFHSVMDGLENVNSNLNTRIDISDATIGIGAIVTFLGLYIGIVFLIACGAILALKELSESVDSIGRYETLRKIGTEEKEISKSMFRQTGIFFLLPLLLAVVHSIFGMKFAIPVLDAFGIESLGQSIGATSMIIILIYGGYFLVTYFCGKGIIKNRR